MRPATAPRGLALDERLLVLDPGQGGFEDRRVRDLPTLLERDDLLVVNDAATLPASFFATALGKPIEVRLVGERASGSFSAVLLGEGDWHTPTEKRPPPEPLSVGDAVVLGDDLRATVVSLSPLSPRLVEIAFDAPRDRLWPLLYRSGKPIQYAHVPAPLELWSVQTSYGSRPCAVEMPSAGRPLGGSLLLDLLRGGKRIVPLTHATGLSAVGDPAIDAALPLPETFEIPESTVRAIRGTRARGGRIVAVGTSVVRALEGSALERGEPRAGRGETSLVIREGFLPRVVSGLLTGMHDRTTSHFQLLQAFAPLPFIERACAHAEREGYLGHEFGDSCLVLSREGRRE
ncbi:S-adenosylmethionine:tRNA ribosyltransferase-isomerase [bacterium]|nr:S-adenosylmethionine:tRNA ribosyltransferase-isomerase [bacterium]